MIKPLLLAQLTPDRARREIRVVDVHIIVLRVLDDVHQQPPVDRLGGRGATVEIDVARLEEGHDDASGASRRALVDMAPRRRRDVVDGDLPANALLTDVDLDIRRPGAVWITEIAGASRVAFVSAAESRRELAPALRRRCGERRGNQRTSGTEKDQKLSHRCHETSPL